MRKQKHFLFFIFFQLILSNILFASNKAQDLGGIPITENQTLVFGGSFSPPTLAHTGVLAHLMTRFGFSKGKMIVALPYKKDAAPASVSLGLTQISVSTFNQVLDRTGIAFRNFKSESLGQATWEDKNKKKLSLEVDDVEIREQYKEDALRTLTYLHEKSGSPLSNFWLAGGDSFASVPTWTGGTPQWKELFNHAHWIVVSRPGVENNGKSIDFKKANPLEGILDEGFLSQYEHSFTNKVHVYKNKDPLKPNIYVVDQPSSDDSSTKNRASLKKPGNHEHAQNGLQPSVFKECLKNGYYGEAFFNRANLEDYIESMFEEIEAKNAAQLTPEMLKDLKEMSSQLIAAANLTVKENKEKPIIIRLLANVYEHIAEHFSDLKNIRLFNNKVREVARQYGAKKFAIAYISLELAELTIVPALTYVFGGAKALALAPFIHPNEMITIPVFLSWTYFKSISLKKNLAGSKKLYKELTNYRNKLLRGDPDAIVMRAELKSALGLKDTNLVLNIVKSRLPKILPLAIRRWDDKKVTWFDLNLSTNELQAILSNPDLASEISDSSKKNQSIFANFLLTAIIEDPAAKLRLEFFAAQRYFKALCFGDISSEILSGYNVKEQEAIAQIKKSIERFREVLKGDQRELFKDLVADVYAVARMAQLHPETVPNLKEPSPLLKNIQDIIATRYPGIKANKKELASIQLQMDILKNMLAKLMPKTFPDKELKINPQDIYNNTTLNAVNEYVDLNRELFLVKSETPINENSFEILPRSSRGTDLTKNNLVWDMHLYIAEVNRQLKIIGDVYERGVPYIENSPHDKRAEKVFWSALELGEERITALKKELQKVEYDWLKLKYPHQLDQFAYNETQIEGYDSILNRYNDVESKIESQLNSLREVSQMMYGSISVNFENIEELRNAVGDKLNLDPSENFLGMNIATRMCERILHFVNKR